MRAKVLSKLVGAAMVAVGLSAGSVVAETIEEWDCGSNPNDSWGDATEAVKCALDADGTFTVRGTGAMKNYSNTASRPWHSSITSITNVIIEDGVTSIGVRVFFDCANLSSITIPDGMTSIGGSAFHGCTSLMSITIPDEVASIGDGAFNGCTGFTSVTIPNGVTYLGSSAFSRCTGLTSITIPDGVINIRDNTFSYCSNLTSVTIGAGVTSIARDAFLHCSGLTSITSLNTAPPVILVSMDGIDAFNGVNISAVTLYVPKASIDAYSEANVWEDFGSIEPVPNVSIRSAIQTPARATTPRISVRNNTLTVSASSGMVSTVNLIDLRGKTVARFRTGESGAGAFSLANVSAGRYMVEIKRGGSRVGMSSVVVR